MLKTITWRGDVGVSPTEWFRRGATKEGSNGTGSLLLMRTEIQP